GHARAGAPPPLRAGVGREQPGPLVADPAGAGLCRAPARPPHPGGARGHPRLRRRPGRRPRRRRGHHLISAPVATLRVRPSANSVASDAPCGPAARRNSTPPSREGPMRSRLLHLIVAASAATALGALLPASPAHADDPPRYETY